MLTDGLGRKITPEQFADNFHATVLSTLEEAASAWLETTGIQNALCPEHLQGPQNLTLILHPETGETLIPSYEECCPKLSIEVQRIEAEFANQLKEEENDY